MESQTSQTNISVLNPAVPPTRASKPRVFLNIVLATFLGSLLGIGLALTLEMAKRRVRSSADLQGALSIPLLGAISSADGILKTSLRKEIA